MVALLETQVQSDRYRSLSESDRVHPEMGYFRRVQWTLYSFRKREGSSGDGV